MKFDIDYLANHPNAVPVLARWLFDEWGHYADGGSVKGTTDNLRERMHRECFPLALIALQGGAPAGTVSLKIREVEILPQYEHWLGTLFVAESCRRTGLGALLVESAKTEVRRLGIDKLYLYTRQSGTQQWYEKLGWVEVERPKYRGRIAVVMSVELDA